MILDSGLLFGPPRMSILCQMRTVRWTAVWPSTLTRLTRSPSAFQTSFSGYRRPSKARPTRCRRQRRSHRSAPWHRRGSASACWASSTRCADRRRRPATASRWPWRGHRPRPSQHRRPPRARPVVDLRRRWTMQHRSDLPRSGCFVKQEQWERWRAQRKLVSGPSTGSASGHGRGSPFRCGILWENFEYVYAKSGEFLAGKSFAMSSIMRS